MFKNVMLTIFSLLAFSGISAQEISIKVVDSKTGEGLPQATVTINDADKLIADADGKFTLPLKFNNDENSLSISYLGYKSSNVTVGSVKAANNTIRLDAVAFELKEVAVNKASLNADSIIVRVKKNLQLNYKNTTQSRKSTIFYRESTVYKPIQANAEMSKSTKVNKQELKAVNDELKKFTAALIKHPPQEATEMLVDYLGAVKTVKDKPVYTTKFIMEKGVKFNEDSQASSAEDVEKKGLQILMKHLDSTKVYRIKSGLFGTRDTVIGQKPEVNKAVTPNLNSAKSRVMSFLSKNSVAYGYRINFVSSPELYEYTLAGTKPYGTDGYVYILKFKPRKRKAKYAGTLYISPYDYAVVRADYDLAEGKVVSGLNLKFILGIKQSENISRGTIIYKEKTEGGGYYLHYASNEEGQYVYINRPLKFIEITDDDKEKVAYDLKVELNMLDKSEYLNVARGEITEAEFDQVKEEEFNYLKPEKYDPAIWQQYGSNPPAAIKKLKSAE